MSGQALTQAMQPTQRSAMSSGMRGARRLKSRVAAVPGGMTLRASPRPPAAPGRRRRGGRRGRPCVELLDVGVMSSTAVARRGGLVVLLGLAGSLVSRGRSSSASSFSLAIRRSRAPRDGRSSRGRRSASRSSSSATTTSRWMWPPSSAAAVEPARRAVDRDRRAGHQVADREARPVRPQVLGARGHGRSVWLRTPTSSRRRRRRPAGR